jgi:hypothetical protein
MALYGHPMVWHGIRIRYYCYCLFLCYAMSLSYVCRSVVSTVYLLGLGYGIRDTVQVYCTHTGYVPCGDTVPYLALYRSCTCTSSRTRTYMQPVHVASCILGDGMHH